MRLVQPVIRAALILGFVLLGPAHAAGLTFEQTLVEVQAAPDAKSVVADFPFENRTGQAVTIAKYEKTCTCMQLQVSDGKLIYAPGEKGVIRATFEIGNFSGIVDKPVNLWFDKDPEDKPSLVLTTRVRIPVLVVLDHKTLKWGLGAKPETRTIDIRMDHAKPIRILTTTCTLDTFKLDLTTIEDGRHYELHVTPANTDAQCLGVVRIETDCDIPRHKVQMAFVTVQRKAPEPAAPQPESPGREATPHFPWFMVGLVAVLMVIWLGLRIFLLRKR